MAGFFRKGPLHWNHQQETRYNIGDRHVDSTRPGTVCLIRPCDTHERSQVGRITIASLSGPAPRGPFASPCYFRPEMARVFYCLSEAESRRINTETTVYGERNPQLTNRVPPACCGLTMLPVGEGGQNWRCSFCGTVKSLAGIIIATGESDRSTSRRAGNQDDGPNAKRQDRQAESEERVAGPEKAVPRQSAVTDSRPRCWKCGRTLAKFVTRPWSIRCRRCKANNTAALQQ